MAFSVFKEDSKSRWERYKIFLEDVADGFFETDLHGNFTFFNNALARIFGYARQEIQKNNYSRFMDEDDAQAAYKDFNRLFKTEKVTAGIKWKIRRKDNEIRILEINANLIFDDNGKKIGFRGIARDMTDRIQSEKALIQSEKKSLRLYHSSRQAEKRYRTLLEFLPDPIFVLDPRSQVTYVNPAFESVFGWTLEELEGRRIPFVPEGRIEETRRGTAKLFKEKVIRRFETQRWTKGGRLLDVKLNAALFYESDDEPAGQVVSLRNITRQKRVDRINQALFKIATSLHRFRTLDARLAFITEQIRALLSVEGSMVILLDEEKNEFFFRKATFDDEKITQQWREVRFPADKGIAGEVVKTGKPVVVPDTRKSKIFLSAIDERAGFRTRNMLDVPLESHDRIIGVLCAVNKTNGTFDKTDVELLGSIAGMVALPLENARINEALNRSYEEVKILNTAKDRVIHHLSHELKTPISVLSASLGLLSKKTEPLKDTSINRIIDRGRRNLNRLLDMQYEIEDISRGGDIRTHKMLTTLLNTCSDELEMLISENLNEDDVIDRIRTAIDAEFGPKDLAIDKIPLDTFVRHRIDHLQTMFTHRQCRIKTRIHNAGQILIPEEVLRKVVDGLIRNAVENTPDGSLIRIRVHRVRSGPIFAVTDFGIGITQEHQSIIFDSCFSTTDVMQYASKQRFDFNAGGRGFDLLRMKIFAERYDFDIQLNSIRCRFIPKDTDQCPGDVDLCKHCTSNEDCLKSGGTTVTIRFNNTLEISDLNG